MIRVGELMNGRYEVQQRVGMGGMADVYKAMDRKLNRYVAIKVLKSEFCSDKSFVAKFQAEARAAAGLSHPNIVSVYDVAEESGSYFIVMELIDGITLKQYIEKKGRLSIKEATSIAIQVATGIEAAHQNSIIHRDIKPQNIIISKDGKVKIADFGIAKAISANTNTISSNVMGSVHYSSPEQSRGGYLDAKSDIYSLGIVMFEMVTGRVPFDGDTTVAVAIQHLQEDIPAPSTYNPDIPVSLEKIILKCTAKSPSGRYPRAGLLISDLKQSLLTPNEDFIEVEDEEEAKKTMVMSHDEMAQIKVEASRAAGKQSKLKTEETMGRDNRGLNKRPVKSRNKADDIDDDISPRSEKIMGIITVIAAIAIIVVVIMIIIKIGNVTGSVTKKGDTTSTQTTSTGNEGNTEGEDPAATGTDNADENGEFTVPNVVGTNIDSAAAKLEEKGLIVIRTEAKNVIGMPLTVISQNPMDTKVVSGDTVELTYIAAKEQIDIPTGLENMGEEEVTSTLKNLGFVVKPDFQYHDEVEAGKVIGTEPKGGAKLEHGGTIKLIVSKGKEALKMVNLLGLSRKAAEDKIKELGLVLDKVEENVSSQYKEGEIMQQSIEPDAEYVKGDKITITVSLGIQDQQEEFVWMWTGSISEPEDYTGKAVRIVMEQTDGANIKSKTLYEGTGFDFENHRFAEYALIPGVDTGKVYVYELAKSGEYSMLYVTNIRFQMISE